MKTIQIDGLTFKLKSVAKTICDTGSQQQAANRSAVNLPPKPTHVCIDENCGPVIGRDLLAGKPIYAGKWVKL